MNREFWGGKMKTPLLALMLIRLSIFDRMSCVPHEENFIRPSYCQGSVVNETYRTVTSRGVLKCCALCAQNSQCLSVSYLATNRTCKLSHETMAPYCTNSHIVPDSVYYQKNGSRQECLNGGIWSGDKCNCTGGYIGPYCERLMTDCNEGFREGYEEEAIGLYTVFPHGAPSPFNVLCRMFWGGRTYVMMHYKSTTSFNLKWDDYVNGFDLDGPNDWIGLKKLNWLTAARNKTLLIELVQDTGKYHLLAYDDFQVGDESTEFRLLGARINRGRTSKKYNITDCLGLLVGSAFSTKDRDNDGNDERNCSQDYRSGWWFNSQCSQCNPTGDIQPTSGEPRTGVNHEVYWHEFPWSLKAINAWLV